MVKLHFLEEEDDEEEEFQLQAPKLNQFKPRKLKRNFGSTAKATSSNLAGKGQFFQNTSQLFPDYESEEQEDFSVFQQKLHSNLKKKTLVGGAPIAEALVKDVSHKKKDLANKKRNVKDYLKFYESTTETATVEVANGIDRNSEKTTQDPVKGSLKGENIEGHTITGSDLDCDGDVEVPLQNDFTSGTRETATTQEAPIGPESVILPHDRKRSAMRRKEIEEALSETNLDDLDNFESLSDGGNDGHHALGSHSTKDVETEVISLDLKERQDLTDSETVMSTKRHKKAQLIFHAVAPLEEQLQLTQEKLSSLSDLVSKRELQVSHLKAELDSLTSKTDQYAQQMSKALCNCR